MHAQITSAQARALATLVATLRPDWTIPGVAAAISKARHRAPAAELAHAAIRLATRTDLRTPAVLAEDGPHWHPGPDERRDEHRFTRCPQPGHQSYPAWHCGACRADQIATDEPRPVERPTDPHTYRRGAQAARAALTNPGATT